MHGKKKEKSMVNNRFNSTDLQLDINWFRRRIRKADLEDREFKRLFSLKRLLHVTSSQWLWIGNLKPLAFLIHEGSPNDAKLFKVMKELKRRRIVRKGDVTMADKGYYSYRNYVMAISRFKVVPLIFPRKNFSLSRALGMFSHLEVFFYLLQK